ncbi:MAG: GtrA family protein [Solirubrobacterales bacterium]
MQWAVKKIDYIFYGKLKHLSRFTLVGAANTLLDFIVFTIVSGVFGVGYLVSQVTGYGFGIMNSFILNRNWTFRKKNRSKKQISEFIQFLFVNLITLGITLTAMRFMVQSMELNIYVSKIMVTFIAQISNFILYKFWIFN